jgi:hypothetical protein
LRQAQRRPHSFLCGGVLVAGVGLAHNVVLIGRPRHVEVIKRQGLRLETQTFDEHIRVAAIGGDQQARG